MSTSLVHVLTIIGKGAIEVEAACQELLARRIQQHPTGHGSSDWTENDHQALEQLCMSLVNASRNLPVLYYAQYLDPWTVADSRFHLLQWPDARRLHICGSTFGLAFYPSRFSHDFLEEIEKLRHAEFYHSQAEDRWYLDHVKEAIDTALWLEDKFLVVCISECIGPTRHDEEIKASLDSSILCGGLLDSRGSVPG
jgi:hypothetical protein